MVSLHSLRREVVRCRLCPRLVAYRERVAREKVRRYLDEDYWGRPVPGFGDPEAWIFLVGLAPAAHGGNRTGRVFTGDRSGDFLFQALYRAGLASQSLSRHRADGLRLRGCYIASVVRCAPPGNKPLPEELERCRPYLQREHELLRRTRVVVALGRIAFDAVLRMWADTGGQPSTPRPAFRHGQTSPLPDGSLLIASYHPSQRNTQTGLLTPEMFDQIFAAARRAGSR
jgi:uracil-DNA glycosylase family 4